MNVAFDTLAFSKRLEESGLDRKTSEAVSLAMSEVAMRDVATKADLTDAVHQLTVRGFAALSASTALIVGAFALFH